MKTITIITAMIIKRRYMHNKVKRNLYDHPRLIANRSTKGKTRINVMSVNITYEIAPL